MITYMDSNVKGASRTYQNTKWPAEDPNNIIIRKMRSSDRWQLRTFFAPSPDTTDGNHELA